MKKDFIAILIFIVVVFFLGGCSSKENPEPTSIVEIDLTSENYYNYIFVYKSYEQIDASTHWISINFVGAKSNYEFVNVIVVYKNGYDNIYVLPLTTSGQGKISYISGGVNNALSLVNITGKLKIL